MELLAAAIYSMAAPSPSEQDEAAFYEAYEAGGWCFLPLMSSLAAICLVIVVLDAFSI